MALTGDSTNTALTPGQFLAAQRRRATGHCAECGAPFEGTLKRRYCSAACRSRAWARAQIRGGTEAVKPRTNTQPVRQCLECQRPLEVGASPLRRYCSLACRQSAYRGRKIRALTEMLPLPAAPAAGDSEDAAAVLAALRERKARASARSLLLQDELRARLSRTQDLVATFAAMVVAQNQLLC